MKKSFSNAEKWLMLSPLPIFVFLGVFMSWKKKVEPEILATPLPVQQACFLPDGKMFVVMGRANLQSNSFPTAAIFDLSSGKQLKSTALHAQIDNLNSHVSPDGKFWLVYELDYQYYRSMVLRDLDTLKIIHSFEGQLFKVNWLSDQTLTVDSRRGSELWEIDQDGGMKSHDIDTFDWSLSPDGRWRSEIKRGKRINYSDNDMNGYPEAKIFTPQDQ